MRRTKGFGTTALVLTITLLAAGQSFKVYPGAKKYTPADTEETREAQKSLPPGRQSNIYLTDDSFDRVVAFYKGVGKEYTMPNMPKVRKLPNGQELHEAYFILDGASDLSTSRNWAKVQRPFIGSVDFKGGMPEYHDVRDVTTITVLEKK